MRIENSFSIYRGTEAVLEDLRLKAYQQLTGPGVWYLVSLYGSFICSAQDGPQALCTLSKSFDKSLLERMGGSDRFPAESLALCILSSLTASRGFCLFFF